jgi:arylsulfatase A-like enzyme
MISQTSLSSLANRLCGLFVRSADATKPSWWRTLLPALLLGWMTMGVALFDVYQRVMRLRGSSRVGSAILEETIGSPVLQGQIAAFLGSHLLLHTLFAVILWLLALATVRAFPAWRVRTFWITAAWWVLLGSWIYVANAMLFTDSVAGPALEFVRQDIFGQLNFYHLFTTALAFSVILVLARAAVLSPARRTIVRVAVYGVVVLVAAAVLAGLNELQADPAERPVSPKPHVILIGIDSLRPDMVGIVEPAWYTPHINSFLRESQVFPDAMTPLARTFSSWMSILTGRHPVSTGARDNLVPFERLQPRGALSERLRSQGYRTIYATDDVRFSNIDERYGFDQIIGPRMGASDFVLGNFNDMPLSNLVANTRLAAWLFPNTYSNRAAEVTYRPSTFVEWLARDVEFGQPTFLAVHLTLPHFPFTWAHESGDAFSGSHDSPFPYLAAVVAADKQFASLMKLLDRKGALENAIVVVMSDHGEGLGLPADNLIPSQEAKDAAKVMVWMWGHGTSVLSPQQYSVVMAFRRYIANSYAAQGVVHSSVPASLEDIAPTVLELADVAAAAAEFDGLSLASLVDPVKNGPPVDVSGRVRFTETGISVALLKQGNPDKEGLLAQGAFYFGVNKESARVELRTDQWDFLISGKERAAVRGDWLLAAFPVEDGSQAHKYLLVNRKEGMPRRLESVPDASKDPIAASLYEALQRRFPGELRPPAAHAKTGRIFPAPRSGGAD